MCQLCITSFTGNLYHTHYLFCVKENKLFFKVKAQVDQGVVNAKAVASVCTITCLNSTMETLEKCKISVES